MQRQYKEPRWAENRKATNAKVRGISLGWESRQKLGIIPKRGEGSLQRKLLPSTNSIQSIESVGQDHAYETFPL